MCMRACWRTASVMVSTKFDLRTRGLVRIGLILLCPITSMVAPVAAQTPEVGIYVCTDARGRKLTSDRPIPECADREQKLLNPSGTVKGKIGPVLTVQQRAELEAREKADQEERARLAEEKRRDRALMVRYPSKEIHDRERVEALAQVHLVIATANIRVKELQEQRVVIDRELEFYQKDPSKVPPLLRRQVDENAQSLAVQQRFIVDKLAEIKRVNDRFDAELVRLKQLWLLQRGVSVPASAPAIKSP